MSVLSNHLDAAFGSWTMTDQGIVSNGRLVVPKGQIKIWLARQRQIHASMPTIPVVRPKPLSIPRRPLDPSVFDTDGEAAATPMPFLKKPKGLAKKAEELKCSKCGKIWEDCDCGHVWCPYCGFEPNSGTQRGLDMHIKAKHPEIDWG